MEPTTFNRYGVLGALDRYNAGDTLLAEVAATFIKDPIYYSPLGGNLLNLCGPVSFPSTTIDTELEGLLIAGGEVLSASWFGAWASTYSSKAETWLKIVSKSMPNRLQNKISRRRAKSSWASPYMLPENLQFLPTAYISVGGLIEDIVVKSEFRSAVNSMQRTCYVSVRDLESQLQLKKFGIKSFLAPDPVSILASQISSINRNGKGGYLLVQCSLSWIKSLNNQKLITDFITYVEKTGLKSKFLCAGNTAMHSDLLAYKLLRKDIPSMELIDTNGTKFFKEAIANSEIFVGTSLHGHVLATAFSIPSIKLRGIPKLNRYLDTWCPRIMSLEASCHDFRHLVKSTFQTRNLIEQESKYLASLATENYRRGIAAI